ncbi:MAG: hypothetical protein GY953_54075 [bacterium]|nr:hypothetical protein [bacterium]
MAVKLDVEALTIIRTDEVVGWIAGTLENLCHLAGMPEIAERIRGCVR